MRVAVRMLRALKKKKITKIHPVPNQKHRKVPIERQLPYVDYQDKALNLKEFRFAGAKFAKRSKAPLFPRSFGSDTDGTLTITGSSGSGRSLAIMSVDGVLIYALPHFDAGPTGITSSLSRETALPGLEGSEAVEVEDDQPADESRETSLRKAFPDLSAQVKIVGFVHNEADAGATFCTLCEFMGYCALTLMTCPNCCTTGCMKIFDRFRTVYFKGLSTDE